MFVPLKDDNPLRLIRFQYVTLALIVLNVVIYLLTGPLVGEEALMLTVSGFGLVPSELLHGAAQAAPPFQPISEPLTLFTHMFLHAGWIHLLGNMAFLWVFADNIEDAFGPINFTIFYLLCGVGAGLTHVFMQAQSVAPLIGASGAMSGVLAAYLLLYPKARVWILLLMRLPLKIPAWIILGGWLILQFVSLTFEDPDAQSVAWWAHIGGFATGLILTLVLRSPLLIREIPSD
jgi:membrane associated rhomboid family serine protease